LTAVHIKLAVVLASSIEPRPSASRGMQQWCGHSCFRPTLQDICAHLPCLCCKMYMPLVTCASNGRASYHFLQINKVRLQSCICQTRAAELKPNRASNQNQQKAGKVVI